MTNLPHINDANVEGKRVFLRCDHNVPINGDGKITDDSRIKASLRTIHELLDMGAIVLVTSHLGRPKGGPDPRLSLKPVADRLTQLIGINIPLIEEYISGPIPESITRLQPGQMAVLENVRFFDGESKNDPELARAYARLADIFVNDAFGTSHRAHASVHAIAEFLPHYAGYLLEDELDHLRKLISPDVVRPYIVVLGGAKAENKLPVLEFLKDKVDTIMIGGSCANTFLKAIGKEIGTGQAEDDLIDDVRRVLNDQHRLGYRIELPRDLLVAPDLEPNTEPSIVDLDHIPPDCSSYDVGPKTIVAWKPLLRRAGTVLWNGPVGMFEDPRYVFGTRAVAKAIALSTRSYSVAGGGETMSAINKLGLGWGFSHISTGGGASLEYMSGKLLPGVAALMEPQPETVESAV
ncbi:MAG TPA: phosphoglycerate kinase [bacterium]|jgi:phosphoglycerate kinase